MRPEETHRSTRSVGALRSALDQAREVLTQLRKKLLAIGRSRWESWIHQAERPSSGASVIERVPPSQAAGQSRVPSNSLDTWLRSSGYEEVADRIVKVTGEWAARGNRSRRNWWDVLAGDRRGNPRTIGGETFPIIAAIRERQNLPAVEHALRSPDEVPLPAKGA